MKFSFLKTACTMQGYEYLTTWHHCINFVTIIINRTKIARTLKLMNYLVCIIRICLTALVLFQHNILLVAKLNEIIAFCIPNMYNHYKLFYLILNIEYQFSIFSKTCEGLAFLKGQYCIVLILCIEITLCLYSKTAAINL